MALKEVTIKGKMWCPDDATDKQIIQTVESVFHDDIIDDDNPMRYVEWMDYDVFISK